MKRIGVTQRVSVIESYGERRDQLDQNWAILCEKIGAACVPLSNHVEHVPAYLDALALDALILSGGNNLSEVDDGPNAAPERDAFERKAVTYFMDAGKPVLGVCRGAQLLQHLEGGALVTREGHVATRHALSWKEPVPVSFEPFAEVNSYHNFVIDGAALAPCFAPLATAPDGSVEAFFDAATKRYAVMWHPEREPLHEPKHYQFIATLLEL